MVRRKFFISWQVLLAWLFIWHLPSTSPTQYHSRPTTVKIGALISSKSRTGKCIKMALELALDKVNEDPSLLNGTKLALLVADSNSNAFQGAASAMELVDDGVVAILGPQTSAESHFVAYIAEATHVPLVSFSATDPALSQLTYFNRVVPSDAMQMAAVASIIDYYGWKEVVALFTSDDLGKNSIRALRNALEQLGSRIVYTKAFNPSINREGFGNALVELNQMKTRVFVVHMQPDLGLTLLSVAIHLRMLSASYVWIVTDGITNILDTIPVSFNSFEIPQGIIGIRRYIPISFMPKDLLSEVKNKMGSAYLGDQYMTTHSAHAYDALWMVAKAVHSLMDRKHGSFHGPNSLTPISGEDSDLAKQKVFNDGSALLHQLLETRFSGVTGFIGLDAKGDCLNSVFEIVNRVDIGLKIVGYWTVETGCVIIPPIFNANGAFNATTRDKVLGHVIWPGGSTKAPRGWVDPKDGRPLRILVPRKTGLRKFVETRVDAHNKTIAFGFCIDVFKTALSYLPYNVSYTFTSFGTGSSTPIYDDLVGKVASKEFDAAVGDIAITRKRSKIVDFTQPYIDAGLVVVVPVMHTKSDRTWEFLQPFTLSMWCTMAASFVLIGVVLWVLEHRKNKDFRGKPKKQIITILWFILSTLFFTQREKVTSIFGRIVLIVWFFVVLIITSSYTASLTSILTIQQLRPAIEGISGLITSDVRIGYQSGSYVKDYLLELGIAKERLIPLNTLSNFSTALSNGLQRGGVGAIVDELPDIQLLLSRTCKFEISGQEFSKGSWGFAFQKGSQLAIHMSTAILKLIESGEWQHIHDKWFGNFICESSPKNSNQLGTSAFLGLFLITGIVSTLSIIFYCIRLARFFCRHRDIDPREGLFGCACVVGFVKSFAKFITQEENPRQV